MLLGVVLRAQAHGPAIRRFEPDTPVSAGANVGAFDGDIETTGNAAVVPSDPGAMTGALSLGWRPALLLQSIGKPHGSRFHQDEVRRRLIASGRLVPANIGLARLLGWAGRGQQRLPP